MTFKHVENTYYIFVNSVEMNETQLTQHSFKLCNFLLVSAGILHYQ